jgi:hypothetical protein
MKKRIFILTVLALLLALPAAVFAGGPPDDRPVGPPGGTIYAHDVAYQTVATPTDLPTNAPDDSFDVIYVFPDCPTCASVSVAAPGDADYNGGRWMVIEANGIFTQLTNAEDVEAMASSFNETGTRFVCPLISK